jgi:predicted 2-oxoglutarate/Fe(II)-dependent dioxygenase YbiX
MIVIPKIDPFPHIIVEETFTNHEYKLIWDELMFLLPNMKTPEKTGAARDLEGNLHKKGIGVFIDQVYADRQFSNILTITRKLFAEEIREASNSLDLYFKLFNKLTTDSVLAQLYYNGDVYKSHTDDSLFTAVTLLHKTPKMYSGGELTFSLFDYCPNLKNNQSIIFPSIIHHEVSEVKMQSNNLDDGRFTLSQLMSIMFEGK